MQALKPDITNISSSRNFISIKDTPDVTKGPKTKGAFARHAV